MKAPNIVVVGAFLTLFTALQVLVSVYMPESQYPVAATITLLLAGLIKGTEFVMEQMRLKENPPPAPPALMAQGDAPLDFGYHTETPFWLELIKQILFK